MTDLVVVLDGAVAGVVTNVAGKPNFTYLDDYADDINATALSLSMPLAAGRVFDHRVTAPWLLNLLPDDAAVRDLLAREFGASPNNSTALLAHVGLDCAGAVQLVEPERIDDALNGSGWLEDANDAQLGERLRRLRDAPAQWLGADERWSLAGAQSKFTAVRTDHGWAYARGSAASTHIIKPGIGRFPGQAFNEHLCLRALADVGVTSASSEYVEFDGAAAIVVERYDRIRTADGRVLRLHQEDMCQALSVPPDRKYASDGGPSATAIAGLLAREAAQSDVDRFTDLVVAQYLLGAPDGHAKNYSVILDGLDVILAPAYDIASSLPYDPSRGSGLARIAMPIAGRSKFGEVTLRHIEKFAGAAGTDPDRLVARTREMAAALPDALARVDPDATDDAMVALRANLVDAVAEHCATLRDPTPTAPPARGRSGDQP